MLVAILAGLIVSLSSPALYKMLGKWLFVPMALLPFTLFIYFCAFLPSVLQGHTFTSEYRWVPSLYINLHFYLDGLSIFFALLITAIGTLVMVYAGGYLTGHPLLGRFYLYLSFFMMSMLGLVLSGNIFCMFIFWELTSISSYMLIGFGHENAASRYAALQALLVTGMGGLALMAGLILIGNAGNSYSLSTLLTRQELIQSDALYLPALLLILLAAFTKSAQFPFHFWLPNAMAAPTPVSAFLHSATMVKAGIYLLARFNPIMGGTPEWQLPLLIAGSISAVAGAWLALQQTDLKAILAYSTISALGILVLMIGIGTDKALAAMLAFLLLHALNKCTLFLIAGSIDHATGTRDVKLLQGLGKSMRPIAIAASLVSLSYAGVFPFFGFISKELLYEATLEAESNAPVSFIIVFVSKVASVVIAFVLGYRLFWRTSTAPTVVRHPCGRKLYMPPLVLVFLSLLFGLLPSQLATPLLNSASGAVLSRGIQVDLHLLPKFSMALLNTIFTFIVGYLAYAQHNRLLNVAPRLLPLYNTGPESWYQQAITGLLKGSVKLTSMIQSGYLRSYIAAIVLVHVGLVILSLWGEGPALNISTRLDQLLDVKVYELVLLVLMVGSVFFLFRTRSRLTSIATMGIIGFSVALLYLLFGAPDVSATQFLIETLTVVLFVLVLHRLPPFRFLSHRYRRYKYIILSALFGGMMTYVLLLVKQFPLQSELKAYYGEHGYMLGRGRNLVNVIIVDFRALDTLGEITVLAVTALGIMALLRLRAEKGGKL
ncbi:hydrogen gas-evolving membrane-bound hydrogenase subunit E [Pontibacter ruber]|uniref:Hydrogen gas-evolving membrane-bound hydrogenase subunit E n=1 Tax=Pontibacter ruber TaxID=1343895 RepID=A0ABW5CS69_9BACT|nr:hydrogen gas-evolving membrane-bound hydrogenase subunit E [Pontibacter ruber]